MRHRTLNRNLRRISAWLIGLALILSTLTLWGSKPQAAPTAIARYEVAYPEYGLLPALPDLTAQLADRLAQRNGAFNYVAFFGINYDMEYAYPFTGVSQRAELPARLKARFDAHEIQFIHTIQTQRDASLGYAVYPVIRFGFINDLIYQDQNSQYNRHQTELMPYSYTRLDYQLSSTKPETSARPLVKNQSLAFFDSVGPVLQSIDFFQDSQLSVPQTSIRPNSQNYVRLRFSEPIRFADNSAVHSDVRLRLGLTNQRTNIADVEIQADLTGLAGTDLIFAYQVGTELTDKNGLSITPDHRFSQVVSLLDGSGFDLINNTQAPWTLSLAGTSGSLPQEDQLWFQSAAGAQAKVRSLVVDIAGNPSAVPNLADLSASLQNKKIVIDHVAPHVTRVVLRRDLMNDYTENFLSARDGLHVTMSFSEPLLNATELDAVFNFGDATSNAKIGPARLDSNSGSYIWPALSIAPNMIHKGDPDGMVKVSLDTRGKTVTDYAGNALQLQNIPVPDQAYYLDNTAPMIASSRQADNLVLTAQKYTASSDYRYFYIPFRQYDQVLDGFTQNASGIKPNTEAGLHLNYRPFDSQSLTNQSFQLAVTSSPSVPDTFQDYTMEPRQLGGPSIGFGQIESKTEDNRYLHIRMPANLDYNIKELLLTVSAQDAVGIMFREQYTIQYDAFDRTPPEAAQTGSHVNFDYAAGKGSLSVTARFTDHSQVNGAAFKTLWLDASAPAPTQVTEDWTVVSPVTSQLALEQTFVLADLAAGYYDKDLYVYVEDANGEPNGAIRGPFKVKGFCGSNPDLVLNLSGPVIYSTDSITIDSFKPNNEANTATAVMMVKDPNGGSDDYLTFTIDSTMTVGGQDYQKYVANLLSSDEWQHSTVTYDADTRTYTFSLNKDVDIAAKMNLLRKHYGTLDIKVITFPSVINTTVSTKDPTYNVYWFDLWAGLTPGVTTWKRWVKVSSLAAQNGTLSFFYNKYTWSGQTIDYPVTHEFDFDSMLGSTHTTLASPPQQLDRSANWMKFLRTPRSITLSDTVSEKNYRVSLYARGADNPYVITMTPPTKYETQGQAADPVRSVFHSSTVSGDVYTLQLTNQRNAHVNLDDIDFQNSLTRFKILSPDRRTIIWSAPLQPVNEQSIVVPELPGMVSGMYWIDLTVYVKSLGTYQMLQTEFFIDAQTVPSDTRPIAVQAVLNTSAMASGQAQPAIAWGNADGYAELSLGSLAYTDTTIMAGAEVRRQVGFATAPPHQVASYMGTPIAVGGRFIKVWNDTPGLDAAANKAGAAWVQNNTSGTADKTFYTLIWTDLAGFATALPADVTQGLYLLKGQTNILKYQTVTTTGVYSPEYQLIVREDTAALQLQAVKSSEQLINPTLQVSLSDLNGIPISSKLYQADAENASQYIWAEGLTEQDQTYTFDQDNTAGNSTGRYVAIAASPGGNFTALALDVGVLDGEAPRLEATNLAGSMSIENNEGFNLRVQIRGRRSVADDQLFMTFDTDYNQLISQPEPFAVPGEVGQDWVHDGISPTGLTRVQVTLGTEVVDGVTTQVKTYQIEGRYMRLPTEPDPSQTFSRAHIFTARDQAGNQSAQPAVVSKSSPQFYPLAHLAGMLDDAEQISSSYRISYTFSQPVRLISPRSLTDDMTRFATHWSNIPVYQNDPDATIIFMDLFGVIREEILPLTGPFNFSGVQIALSPPTLTNKQVEAVIKPVQAGAILGFPTVEPAADSIYLSDDKKTIKVILSENGTISFTLDYNDGYSQVHNTVPVAVSNIDKTPPQGKVVWQYAAFNSDQLPAGVTTTTGDIIATIVSDQAAENLYPANGKTIQHTFTYGAAADYTFEFTDEAGNPGQPVTASLSQLGVTIAAPAQAPPPDIEPPLYIVSMVGQTRDGLVLQPILTGDTAPDMDAAAIMAQNELRDRMPVATPFRSLTLNFSLTDQSPVRLLVREGDAATLHQVLSGLNYTTSAANTAGAGVSLNGNQVTLSQNKSLILVMIDARNNMSHLLFATDLIDTTAPSVTDPPFVARPDLLTRRVYLQLSDDSDLHNAGDTIRIRSSDPLGRTDRKEWYSDFATNGSRSFVVSDFAGNDSVFTAIVSDIDMRMPVPQNIRWTPSARQNEATLLPQYPPNMKVHEDVTVSMQFLTPLDHVQLYIEDQNGTYVLQQPANPQESPANLKWDAASASYTFTSNHRVRLVFVALNGETASQDFALDNIIDKEPPDVTMTHDLPPDGFVRQIKVTFTVGTEGVYGWDLNNSNSALAGQKVLLKAGSAYSKIIDENGDWSFRFSDEAGNMIVRRLQTTQIDHTLPEIVLAGLPPQGTLIRGPVTVKASLSEAGVIHFQGRDYPVRAPVDKNANQVLDADPAAGEFDYIDLNVDQDGVLAISATDQAGLKAFSYFRLENLDSEAPSLSFSPATLQIRQQTPLAEAAELMRDGVTAIDNKTRADQIQVTVVEGSLTQTQLNTPGIYQLTYQAKDTVGNTSTTNRWVRVYGLKELEVWVNQRKTSADGTLMVTLDSGSPSVRVTASNMTNGNQEPYTVFVKKGYWTIGKMKTGATEVVGGQFTPDQNGYYTIMVITQNRQMFGTKIYVDLKGGN